MHERLKKPSLLDDDDDEELSNLGKRSNRLILKSKSSKDKPLNDFQKELNERVNSNRSITPKSIDTDSDLDIDDPEENDYFSHLSKKTNIEESGWKPDSKNHSLKLDLRSDNNNSAVTRNLNHESKSPELNRKRSEKQFSKTAKELQDESKPEISPRDTSKGDSELKKKKKNKKSKFAEDSSEDGNMLKTIRYKDSDQMSNLIDTINHEEKSKKSKNKFLLDDDDYDYNQPSVSSRFMKSKRSQSPDSNMKSDKSESDKKKESPKKHSNLTNDDDLLMSSTRYVKSARPKSPEEKSERSDSIKQSTKEKTRERSKDSKKIYSFDDDEDEESYKSSSSKRFLKSPRSRTPEDTIDKSKNKTNDKKLRDEHALFDEFLSSQKLSDSPGKSKRSQSPELDGYSKFLHDNTAKKSDIELNNSTKLLKFNHEDLGNSTKSDIKPKPRKLYLNKNEFDDESTSSKSNLGNVPKDDIKRRSIRFEDEMTESFTKSNKESSRENSPRKSNLSKQSSGKNTPSPPTSICEEVIQDPITMKFKALQQRREEKKRRKEAQFESNQSKLINESIDTVADSQNQKESNQEIISSRNTSSRPSSAKYKNVQPKVTTRINLKSLKSPKTANDWSSTPNLYGDVDDLNSERSYTNSQTIRDAAYLQWYLAKLSEKNTKKDTDISQEGKKKTTDKERDEAYIAWKKAKKEYFLELDRKRKEEEKKREDSKVPVVKDRKSAELAFEVWKKQKEQRIKEESKKKAEDKKQKELSLMKEREMKQSKKSELITGWEDKKAKEMEEKKLQKQKEKILKEENTRKMKQKLLESEKAYREWEEKADLKEKQYSDFEKNKDTLINTRRAWRPSTPSVKTRRF